MSAVFVTAREHSILDAEQPFSRGRLLQQRRCPLFAEIARHALDRVPLSIIFDDSTVLVNLNYFFLRDRTIAEGRPQRWEDVPVAHPTSFTREFAEWCLASGVRGKFSIVPCPAALGRIDEGLPLFSKAQQDEWLTMCREVIVPAFDITPEMLTHTFVLDPKTLQPLPSRIWEQYEWATLPEDQEELVTEYIAQACRILVAVGLTPQGVTSPGGFGGRTLPFYAHCAGEAVRQGHGQPRALLFSAGLQGSHGGQPPCGTPIAKPDKLLAKSSPPPATGLAVGPGMARSIPTSTSLPT